MSSVLKHIILKLSRPLIFTADVDIPTFMKGDQRKNSVLLSLYGSYIHGMVCD